MDEGIARFGGRYTPSKPEIVMSQRKTKIIYWITTGIMIMFMLLASIPDVLMFPDAVTFFKHLGYPAYLLPFIGVAKILGVFAIVVPGFPRLKEWAYAGLVFDLIGAFYSHISVGDPLKVYGFSLIALSFVASSYVFYRKNLRHFETLPEET
jgi:uncharacterized membrane protein YphA (DoxX/SURF4 family)